MFAIFPNCDVPRDTIVTCAQALGKPAQNTQNAQDQIQAKITRHNLFCTMSQTIKRKLGCFVRIDFKLKRPDRGMEVQVDPDALIARLQRTSLEWCQQTSGVGSVSVFCAYAEMKSEN